MKVVLISLIFILAGCQSAGVADYTYKMTDENGRSHEVELHNTKDIGKITATVSVTPEGEIEVLLSEEGVDASGPMATMAESNNKLVEKLIDAVPVP